MMKAVLTVMEVLNSIEMPYIWVSEFSSWWCFSSRYKSALFAFKY